VLRRKTAKSLEQFAAASSGKSVAVPFWIAGDHFMVGWGRVETNPPTLFFVDSGLAGAGVKLAASVIKEAGIKLEEDKAYDGAGGGGKLKIVPYTVRQLSFGDVRENNVAVLYDGPFPWEDTFGFHLAGMVGHDFFKPYAVTFDFENMQIFLQTHEPPCISPRRLGASEKRKSRRSPFGTGVASLRGIILGVICLRSWFITSHPPIR
jgi:hypothetical protein